MECKVKYSTRLHVFSDRIPWWVAIGDQDPHAPPHALYPWPDTATANNNITLANLDAFRPN